MHIDEYRATTTYYHKNTISEHLIARNCGAITQLYIAVEHVTKGGSLKITEFKLFQSHITHQNQIIEI